MDEVNTLNCICGNRLSDCEERAISHAGWEVILCPSCSRLVLLNERNVSFYIPQCREATDAELGSIWNVDDIDFEINRASLSVISQMESELNVRLPAALMSQYQIKNGGWLRESIFEWPRERWVELTNQKNAQHWTNCLVEGLFSIEEWEKASGSYSDAFSDVFSVDDLNDLVVIANTENDYLLLDYRGREKESIPKVIYYCADDASCAILAADPDRFISLLLS